MTIALSVTGFSLLCVTPQRHADITYNFLSFGNCLGWMSLSIEHKYLRRLSFDSNSADDSPVDLSRLAAAAAEALSAREAITVVAALQCRHYPVDDNALRRRLADRSRILHCYGTA